MSMPVGTVDALYREDPKRVEDVFKEAFRQDILPLTGRFFFDNLAFASPLIDVLENRDWAGRPIVPMSLMDNSESEQYLKDTSGFAKAMGKVLNESPLKIEYILNSWSGGLYRRAGNIPKSVDKITGKEKTENAWDIPIIGTLFVREPYAPKEAIGRFYDELEKLNQGYADKTLTRDGEYKRRVYQRISYRLRPLWKDLREKDLTTEERKKIYKDVEELIKIAESEK